MVENILISGLLSGGIYALLAVGFSLVFGVARFPNFAHTGFFMVAAFALYISDTLLNLGYFLSVPIALIIPVLIAIIYYIFVIDRVKHHQMAVMILAIALAMVFQELLIIFVGSRPYGYVPAYAGFMEIGDIRISYQHIIAIVASVIATVAVMLFVDKTKFGYVIRAVSQDHEAASLMGINIGRVYLMVMAISVGLAALAGIFIAPIWALQPYMWMPPMIVVLAASVIGGLGSIKGSAIGAFILAFVEVLVVTLVPSGGYLRGVASLVAMVIVLLFRPEGLFGVVFEEERL